MEQRRSLFGPLLLIAAGVMWLLMKSGNVPTSNLWALAHIWPFLLIAAGLGLILRPYWSYTSIALDILIIGGAVLAILYAPRMGWDNPPLGFSFNENQLYVGPTERGSGTMKTETREVSDFRAVEISYPAEVVISQGTSESLKIEAEDNLLPGLQTRVRNNTLEIFYKSDHEAVRPTKPVKITIVVKDLNQVDFESAGKLAIQGLDTNALNISVSGAGDLKVNDITTKDLSVSLSGAGSMAATGTADNLDMNISGFGSFNGKDLQNKSASVHMSGAGSATVRVAERLDADISGAGSINYYGSPDVTKQVSGVGGVTRSGD
ncbi:MAG TPA: DUF2807 domain-containing protein [Anaerolineales bacterium]|nr:DUF2807 domain-containing protein [Anaerolineales bacterium]